MIRSNAGPKSGPAMAGVARPSEPPLMHAIYISYTITIMCRNGSPACLVERSIWSFLHINVSLKLLELIKYQLESVACTDNMTYIHLVNLDRFLGLASSVGAP